MGPGAAAGAAHCGGHGAAGVGEGQRVIAGLGRLKNGAGTQAAGQGTPGDSYEIDEYLISAKVPSFPGNVNADFSDYASTVNTSFQWRPFTEYLFTELGSEVTAGRGDGAAS